MKHYDTVIFDLDGTLLNTLEDLADGVNYVMKANGFPARTIDEVRRFVGNGIRRLVERAVPQGVSAGELERVFEEFRTYYTEHCQIKTCAYEGIFSLLEQLREKGVSLAIVSNKNAAAVTELNSIYFGSYIGTAIGEREGIRKKPAPDTVLQALKELGKEKETALYVGDSEVDAQTAENTGMDCVLVSWGFRDKEELKKQRAVAIIDEPGQLLDWI